MLSNEDILINKDYSDIKYIGKGSYGTVYKCHNKLKQVVAVKIIEVNDINEINDGLKEANCLIKLNHLNIVKVYNVFLISKNKLAIEMEYLENGSLSDLFFKNKIKLSEKLIFKILQQTCNALQYLEDNEIIHRDLNLNNILIKHLNLQQEEIEIVIIDFGFIKLKNSTFSTSFVGTFGYLAPELSFNEENNKIPYSFKSDIFALGVTIYRLMSLDNKTDICQLYHNYDNNDEKVKQKLINHIKNNFVYSNNLIYLILKMLERNPINRYNAKHILDELINIYTNLNTVNSNVNNDKYYKYVGQFGSVGSENSQFKFPYDILIDNNLIYVADFDNKRISIFNLERKFINQFKFEFKPTCITLDVTTNTFLIGSRDCNVIYRISKDGNLLNVYGTIDLNKRESIAISAIDVDTENGDLYLCNYNDGKIQVLSKEGELIKEFKENLIKPYDILFNNENKELIVSDTDDHCIKIFTKDGQLKRKIGRRGKKESKFNRPRGFIYDHENKQYYIIGRNDRIQIFNDNGKFVDCFGKYGTVEIWQLITKIN